MSTRLRALLAAALLAGTGTSADEVSLKLTDGGYLDAQGFDVIVFSSTFHPVFLDQKNTEIELVLHGVNPAKPLPEVLAGGWTGVEAPPYMDAAFKAQLAEAVKPYVAQLDEELAEKPCGVPPSRGAWGGSGATIDMGVRMYLLHKAFPEIVGKEYTMRAADYFLGTHPISSTSYVSAVGTISKLKAYGHNRADNSFIAGGVIPGYVVIRPDLGECIDDFGMLWFEDEYVIPVASRSILAANAPDALTR